MFALAVRPIISQHNRQVDFAIQQANCEEDLLREKVRREAARCAALPRLKYESGNTPSRTGYTPMKYHNESLVTNAEVSYLSLTITDARQLKRYHLKPQAR